MERRLGGAQHPCVQLVNAVRLRDRGEVGVPERGFDHGAGTAASARLTQSNSRPQVC